MEALFFLYKYDDDLQIKRNKKKVIFLNHK